MINTFKLTAAQIAAIEQTLSNGDRVELAASKDGVKVFRLRRTEIKQNKDNPA